MQTAERKDGVDPFTRNLSVLNLIFSFSLSLFSFTIFLYLESEGIPIILGGIGLSIGQLASILIILPQGRAIDKGYSFDLMVIGSILYGIFLLLLYISVTEHYILLLAIPLIVAGFGVLESTFRSSLNSFVAKAVRQKVVGSNYARILTMETIGSAASFGIMAFGAYESVIGLIFLGSGLILAAFSVLVFTLLSSESRKISLVEESKIKRPSLRESFSHLRSLKKFLSRLISSKVLMSIGTIGFTFFYVPTGLILGIPPTITFLFLLATYVVAALLGKYGEKIIDSYTKSGKIFIVLAMVTDVITYSLVLISLRFDSRYLFLISALTSSPGTILISGAMVFEVKVIGRENRGMFGAVQRLIVGIIAVFMSSLLTLIFSLNYFWMWATILITSAASLVMALTIPGNNTVDPAQA
ncbi:MAG: MFS transporter [Thermoplasmata archaeon]